MQIQLTKTKTITIGGGGGAKKSHRKVDIVGVDLFNGDERGCPAVRLVEKKGALHLTAGFVPPPNGELPDSWETAAKNCSWSLPISFQAPRAAIAVTSPEMFFAQTTLDAFKADLAAGVHKGDENAKKPAKLALIRKPSKTAEEKPAAAAEKPAVKQIADSAIVPGAPLSNGGTRFVMKPMEKASGSVMEAGMPEYQVLWVTRLLPEGKRPTATSIQVRPAAVAASVIKLPEFAAAKGNALVLFAGADEMQIAGYKDGDLVLWRNCRGLPGWKAIREEVKKGLGVDDEMLESVLTDTLIDPRPVLEPALEPILNELVMSRDYLAGKLGVNAECVLTVGLPPNERHFSAIAADRAHLKIVKPDVFGGLETAAKIDNPTDFLGALGAALAVISEEAEA